MESPMRLWSIVRWRLRESGVVDLSCAVVANVFLRCWRSSALLVHHWPGYDFAQLNCNGFVGSDENCAWGFGLMVRMGPMLVL